MIELVDFNELYNGGKKEVKKTTRRSRNAKKAETTEQVEETPAVEETPTEDTETKE